MADHPEWFPIMGAAPVPWALMAAGERWAQSNHGQTLARLAERGGLSPCEAVAVLEGRSWQRMDRAAAAARLREITDDTLRAQLAAEQVARDSLRAELGATARQSAADVAALRAQLAAVTAERDALLRVAQDWLNVMEADEADCTCEAGDVCPLCRCRAVLAGKEGRVDGVARHLLAWQQARGLEVREALERVRTGDHPDPSACPDCAECIIDAALAGKGERG